MTSKTIKISEYNYKWLLGIAAELQKRRGELISLDTAISEMRNKEESKKSIIGLAGKWKMSDKEAEIILSDIYKERKIASRRLKDGLF